MEILNQVGRLFLQALPTVLIVFLFYLILRTTFFRPLERVLAERSARIEGARHQAATTHAAAEEKSRTYQEALKRARGEIYAEQEAARRAVLDERARLLKETRQRANEAVRRAKESIAVEAAATRTQLEKESPLLAGEIARVILGPPGRGPATLRDAR